MINKIGRYDLMYSTFAKSHRLVSSPAGIASAAEKAISEKSISLVANNKFVLNLKKLCSFVKT